MLMQEVLHVGRTGAAGAAVPFLWWAGPTLHCCPPPIASRRRAAGHWRQWRPASRRTLHPAQGCLEVRAPSPTKMFYVWVRVSNSVFRRRR
jgi:hypothetical protein